MLNAHSQSQQILLVPSTQATCFGHTDHPNALNVLYLKLKIKCIFNELVISHDIYKSLILLQPTKVQIYITIFSVCIMFTPTYFEPLCHPQGVSKLVLR